MKHKARGQYSLEGISVGSLWHVGLLQPADFIFWLRIWISYKQEYSMFEVVWVTWKWAFFLYCAWENLWAIRVAWNCAIWLWIMPLSSFLGLEISEMSTKRCQYSVIWIPLNCWVWRFDMNTSSSHQIQLLDVHSLCLQGLFDISDVCDLTGKFDLAWLNCSCEPITYLTSTRKFC
jgi:hypothetical protein